MVRCWLMMPGKLPDQTDECHRNPASYVSMAELEKIGVEYFNIPVAQREKLLVQFTTTRGYNYQDEIVIDRAKMADDNYALCLEKFFAEHLHKDEEIRYILDGSGYFDVRRTRVGDEGEEEEWIRIHCEPGDLLVLPSGIFHRFTLTKDNYIHALRLFKGEPVWTAYNRNAETEAMEEHKMYINRITSAAVTPLNT